ncbi:unnamed protein product [Gadus morhua 'NCC']
MPSMMSGDSAMGPWAAPPWQKARKADGYAAKVDKQVSEFAEIKSLLFNLQPVRPDRHNPMKPTTERSGVNHTMSRPKDQGLWWHVGDVQTSSLSSETAGNGSPWGMPGHGKGHCEMLLDMMRVRTNRCDRSEAPPSNTPGITRQTDMKHTQDAQPSQACGVLLVGNSENRKALHASLNANPSRL